MTTENFTITLPAYFDDPDDFHQYEVEGKGILMGVYVHVGEKKFELNFYDAMRFKQDCEAELGRYTSYVFIRNLVIIPKVNKESMFQAVTDIYEDDGFNLMQPE